MFREICTGVMIKPHGKPHHPMITLKSESRSFATVPQRRQQTCGVLRQEVMINADQTEWEVWTSTGPGPLQIGHIP